MKASEARRSVPDALDDDGGHVERGDVVHGLDEAGAQRRRTRTVQRLQRHRVEHLRTTTHTSLHCSTFTGTLTSSYINNTQTLKRTTHIVLTFGPTRKLNLSEAIDEISTTSLRKIYHR